MSVTRSFQSKPRWQGDSHLTREGRRFGCMSDRAMTTNGSMWESGEASKQRCHQTHALSLPRANYKASLIETPSLWSPALKKTRTQRASHTPTPQLFGQIRVPYALHYPWRGRLFIHPQATLSPCSKWDLGSLTAQAGTELGS